MSYAYFWQALPSGRALRVCEKQESCPRRYRGVGRLGGGAEEAAVVVRRDKRLHQGKGEAFQEVGSGSEASGLIASRPFG